MTDPIIDAVRFLLAHDNLEWLRHRPEVDEFLTDVDACARVVAGIARGVSPECYLGPCGAAILPQSDENASGVYPDTPEPYECPGDVYARQRWDERRELWLVMPTGRCKICKASVETDARQKWLSGEVRDWAFRAAHIADAYGINDKTIRSWAFRGHLKSYWRTEAGLTVEWADPVIDPDLKGDELAEREAEVAAEIKARGPRLHYVGDVLDLAAADAARREEGRAKRARRKEQAA